MGWRFAGIGGVLAFMLVPFVWAAPDAPTIHAEFRFEGLENQGLASLTGSGGVLAFPQSTVGGEEELDGNYSASELSVITHSNQSKNVFLGTVDSDPDPDHWSSEETFTNAHGQIIRTGPESWMMVVGSGAESGAAEMVLGVDQESLKLDPVPRAEFPSQNLTWEGPFLEASSTESFGSITVTGNFTVVFFDFDLSVTSDGTGDDPIETGHYYSNETGELNPEGPAALADLEIRTGELRFTNGAFTFVPVARPTGIYLLGAEVYLVGQLELERATGTLDVGGNLYEVRNADVHIEADGVRAQVQPEREQVLEGTFEGFSPAVYSGNRYLTPPPAGDPDASPLQRSGPWMFLAAIGLVAVGAGIWAVRAWRHAHPRDPDLLTFLAEEDLYAGRNARAVRRARRSLDQVPDHVNATVVLAIALLRSKHNQESVELLRRQIERLGDETGLLRLIKSLAYLELGQLDEATRSLEAALASNPALRSEVEGTDLWEKVFKHSKLSALLDQESENRSYV